MPEDIGKYSNHQLIVCGIGRRSWRLQGRNESAYLSMDSLQDMDHAALIRESYRQWLLMHPDVVLITNSSQYQDAHNPTVPTNNGVVSSWTMPKQGMFVRKPMARQTHQVSLKQLSPTAMADYQQCPLCILFESSDSVEIESRG